MLKKPTNRADHFEEHAGIREEDYVRLIVGDDDEVKVVNDRGEEVELGAEAPVPTEGTENDPRKEIMVPLGEIAQRMEQVFVEIKLFNEKLNRLNIYDLEEFQLGLMDLMIEKYGVNIAGLLSVDRTGGAERITVDAFEVRIPEDSSEDEIKMLQDLKATLTGQSFSREDILPDYLKHTWQILNHEPTKVIHASQTIGTPDENGIDFWYQLREKSLVQGLILADDHRAAHEVSKSMVLSTMPIENNISNLWSIAKAIDVRQKAMKKAEENLSEVMVNLAEASTTKNSFR
ncbi:hypothetical protein KAR91_04565 [Candidatus Pacearchaeota archaeon]|nr:hypothetical protein [Candidatus Pacearchaeota archaeon]